MDGHLEPAALLGHHGVAGFRITEEQHPGFARLLVIRLAESVGADVAAQNGHLSPRQAALDLQRVPDRFRTADPAAIRVLVVAAFDALNHDHGGVLLRRQFRRQATARQRSFKLALRGHVRVLAVQI